MQAPASHQWTLPALLPSELHCPHVAANQVEKKLTKRLGVLELGSSLHPISALMRSEKNKVLINLRFIDGIYLNVKDNLNFTIYKYYPNEVNA